MATNNMYQERIQQNQKFLLRLLNLHIGHYYPLRKWLGISYKGKIDDISHLSFGYNTKYFKKKGQWYKQQTREYQQPDLGYKLNLVLDRIPQLALLPALLQPAYRLASVLLFSLTTTTYQPSTKDSYIRNTTADTNYGTDITLSIGNGVGASGDNKTRTLLHFDITDIPNNATFTQGDISLYQYDYFYYEAETLYMYRLTHTNWTEAGVTWNKYDGTNAWTTAGGDYTTTNGVSRASDCTAGWKIWSSATLIQDCYNNQSKNVHLIGIMTTNGDNRDQQKYYSNNYTTNTSLRPKLTVTYTVPANFFPFF